jgi:hypothetical protein
VVDSDRVGAEPARRLHEDDDVARAERGQDDLAVWVLAPVDEQFTRRVAPVTGDRRPQRGVDGGEPGTVVGGPDPDRVARHLLLGEPVLVLAAGGDDRVDERVAVTVGHAG